jgi:hypothetical protein
MRYALENCKKTVSVNGKILMMEGESINGKPFTVTVNLADMNRWLNGGLAQDCFPYLSADDRELCMSGIDPEHWDDIFGEDE